MMNKNKKTLIQKAVIAPLVIGAVTAVLFFIMLPVVSGLFPLSKQEIKIADFQQNHTDIALDKSTLQTDGSVKKSNIIYDERNQLIGSVAAGGVDIPLLYDADNVSLTSALSFSSEGDYIGETGCAYVYGYRSLLDINSFFEGQEVEVATQYGRYIFVVSQIKTVSAEYMVYSMNTGVKRGLVLYTNADGGYGISNSFDAVVMELKSGPAVTE